MYPGRTGDFCVRHLNDAAFATCRLCRRPGVHLRLLCSNGKKIWLPSERSLHLRPIESASRVRFSARRDVFVPRHVFDRVLRGNGCAEARCGFILLRFEDAALKSLEFNSDRVVIAIAPTSVFRSTGMPCPVVATHELPQLAIASDVKVGGNNCASYPFKIRVRAPIQAICKQALHFVSAKLPWGQADGVNDDQVHRTSSRARSEVG